MPTITLGDGRKLTVGDEFTKLSPDEQQSWVNDVASSTTAPQFTPGQGGGPGRLVMNMTPAQTATEAIKGGYKALDAGTAQALAGMGGAPHALAALAEKGLYGATNVANRFMGYPEYTPPEKSITDYLPRTQDVQDFIQKTYYGGEKPYEPQNLPERYLKTTGEFIPGMLGGAGGLATRALGQVIVPAVLSETAGHIPGIAGTAMEPFARFIGALGGGVGGAFLTRPGTATGALSELMSKEGITEDMVNKAHALMTQNVALTWPEALSQIAGRPILTDLQRHLEASPKSAAQMSQFMASRPAQIAAAGNRAISQLSPGPEAPQANIGPEVGRTATAEARQIEQQRTAAVEPYYQAARTEHVPGPEIQDFINKLDAAIAADKTGIVGDRLKEIKSLLTEKPAVPPTPGTPAVRTAKQTPAGVIYTTTPGTPGTPGTPAQYLTDIENLDRVRKYIRDKTGMPQIGAEAITKEQSKEIFKALDDLRARMVASSKNLQTGKQLYQDITEKYVRPLMEGPLKHLADKDLETNRAINILFPKGEQNYSPGEISDAVARVATRSPKAAADLVRAHAQRTFDEATQDLPAGANQFGGARFRTTIIGNARQRENLKAAVEALPNGADRWEGFSRFMDLMEATGYRQGIGSKTAYNTEFLRALEAKGGTIDTLVKGLGKPTQFFQPMVEKYRLWRGGKDLNGLASMLTDPGSADLLREMARTNPASHRAFVISNALINYANAANVGTAKER